MTPPGLLRRLRARLAAGATTTRPGPPETDAAERLVASGLLDVVWWRLVTGRPGLSELTALDAARELLGGGAVHPPTPLLDLLMLPPRVRESLEQGRVTPLLEHLADRGSRRPVGPLLDPRAVVATADPAADVAAGVPADGSSGGGGVLGAFLRGAEDETPLPGHPGLTLGGVRRALADVPLHSASSPAPTTLVVPAADPRVSGDRGVLAAGITAVSALRSPEPLRVVVAVRDPSASALLHLGAVGLADPRVGWSTTPQPDPDGSWVAVLPPGARARAGWLGPLLERLADPTVAAVAPLLLRPDDTLVGLGPDLELAGRPPEDAHDVGERSWPTLPPALVVRAADLGPLEPTSPELAASLLARGSAPAGGRLVVEPRSRVTLPEPGPLPAVPAPPVRPLSIVEGRPRLRWGLRLPSPPGDGGDSWGDTHFAASLAAALEAHGQEVVTHRRGAHGTAAAAYDDVALGLRGLHPIGLQPGAVNLLWVISHPEDVDPAELVGFDVVAAASPPWAASMSALAGRPVLPLLQATDPAIHPDLSAPAGDGSRPVFVGVTNPQRPRRIVLDAVAAGVPVEVHGPGWPSVVPEELLGTPYVANASLGALYRTHGLVLADHWPDMAAEGFLANRLYDAVASGARVVCDPVAGLELFEGAVRPYADLGELALLCSPAGRSLFPDPGALDDIARRVAHDHSFHQRARQLLDLVVPVWQSVRR